MYINLAGENDTARSQLAGACVEGAEGREHAIRELDGGVAGARWDEAHMTLKSWHFTSSESPLRGPGRRQNNHTRLSKLSGRWTGDYFRIGE